MLPRISPMRLSITKPFDSADHIFELKHDGFRAIAYIENGECRLVSRNLKNSSRLKGLGNLWTLWPRTQFGWRNRLPRHPWNQPARSTHVPARSSRFLCIRPSLVEWRGFADVSADIDRKERVHKLVKKSACDRLLYAQHIEGAGVAFFEEICQRNLEGIVAKPKTGVYKSNGRGWLKIKNPNYSQAEGRHELFKRR
jgi:bifunctional non-homologous end joining protein LigD